MPHKYQRQAVTGTLVINNQKNKALIDIFVVSEEMYLTSSLIIKRGLYTNTPRC